MEVQISASSPDRKAARSSLGASARISTVIEDGQQWAIATAVRPIAMRRIRA